jgi:hypothetical protein
MTRVDTIEVTLPGGMGLQGDWHRSARLRALSGRDEAFLSEEVGALLPAQRTTALLTRCLVRLGPLAPVTSEVVRALTAGDREALLLHLRRHTLGDRMQCTFGCPRPGCGETLDLDLKVSDLLLPAYPHAQAHYETTISENGHAYRVQFHVPTGADQEAAAPMALNDPEAGAMFVLHRCVEQVTAAGQAIPLTGGIPAAVAEALPRLMAELDPQAEIVLKLTCPTCRVPFSLLFDPGEYLCRELVARRPDLYREVHLLAFHYHWAEAEIMAMTGQKRRLYLGLLAETLGPGAGR